MRIPMSRLPARRYKHDSVKAILRGKSPKNQTARMSLDEAIRLCDVLERDSAIVHCDCGRVAGFLRSSTKRHAYASRVGKLRTSVFVGTLSRLGLNKGNIDNRLCLLTQASVLGIRCDSDYYTIWRDCRDTYPQHEAVCHLVP